MACVRRGIENTFFGDKGSLSITNKEGAKRAVTLSNVAAITAVVLTVLGMLILIAMEPAIMDFFSQIPYEVGVVALSTGMFITLTFFAIRHCILDISLKRQFGERPPENMASTQRQ